MRFPTNLLLPLGLSLSLLLGACSKAQQSAPALKATPEVEPQTDGDIGLLAPGEPLTGVSVEADDARQGSTEALVTVVAFLDFECSFCREGFDTLMRLRAAYKDEELRIVFKHMPLRSHPQALPAAIAGQAVRDVGGSDAFFHFARLAFAGSHEISYETLASWADSAGVTRELYNERVGSQLTLRRVAQDAGLGRQAGVTSTPTFFVNGRIITGAQPLEVFRKAIAEELNAMKGSKEPTWRRKYQRRVASNMKESLVVALLAQAPDDLRVPVADSPAMGSEDALVTMVIFTDFECPFCKQAEKTVLALQKSYGSELRLVFKHLPLPFHEHARPAALLVEAIYQKSGSAQFFLAARDVFEKSPELSRQTLEKLGRKYGLTSAEIGDTLEGRNQKANERLEADRILADDVLARGTPHFFINGKRLSGARPIGHFEALIEYEKKRALKLISEGTPRDKIYEDLQRNAVAPGAPTKLTAVIPLDGRPIKGSRTAKVTIHIFSDFQCPYCQRGEGDLALLAEQYPEELRFVWHDLPLDFHERARPAARAARFAYRRQGDSGFWKMHDALFNRNDGEPAISDNQIKKHGRKLGLNEKELMKAIETDSLDQGIDSDVALAESIGVHGTPAYIIGGYLVTGARPLNHLIRVVKLALQDLKTEELSPSPEKRN